MSEKSNLESFRLSAQVLKQGLKVILLLVIIIVLTEVSLRIFGVGKQISFISDSKEYPGFCEMNPLLWDDPQVTEKNPLSGNHEIFRKIKQSGTIRIFVIGDLNYNSWPYNSNSSFHRVLTQELQRSYPATDFEVINLSLSGVPVCFFRGIPEELKRFEADAVIIYAGNNEIKAQCENSFLQGVRIAELFGGKTISDAKTQQEEIKYGTAAYNKCLERFEKNLDQLLTSFKIQGIPVMISSLVCAEKGQQPFKYSFSGIFDANLLQKHLEEGLKAFAHKDYNNAYQQFSGISRKDNGNALCNYYLGELAYQNHEFEKARSFFRQAINLDCSWKRAPEDINNIIRKTAILNGSLLIDSHKIFEAHSASGIIDESLFLQASRPNIAGNILIAEAFFEKFSDLGIIKEKKQSFAGTHKIRNLMFTKFDSLYETISSRLLNEDSPQYGNESIIFDNSDSTPEGKRAVSLSKKQENWVECMNQLYEYYIHFKNYPTAFKVIESLALANPYNPGIYKKAANTASALGDSQMVVYYARKAFQLHPDIQLAEHLFINYLKLDMPEYALPFVKYARDQHASGLDLSVIYAATREVINLKEQYHHHPENLALLQQIATKYYEMGNTETAMKYSKSPTNPISL